MNTKRVRELTLQANQLRTEHDEQLRIIFQQIERKLRRESESSDAIDIHQAAVAEFDLDSEAVQVLNEAYAANRMQYLAVLKVLRLRRQNAAPWESAAK